MATRFFTATFGAALIGLSAIAATATPAAADSLSFGFRVGEPNGGYYGHYSVGDSPAYYPAYRPAYRQVWAPERRVKVCEPVWTTKKYLDRYGRVTKIVKVQKESCHWVIRHR